MCRVIKEQAPVERMLNAKTEREPPRCPPDMQRLEALTQGWAITPPPFPIPYLRGKWVAPVTETAVQLYHPSLRERAGVQWLQKCSDTIQHLWAAVRWTGLYFCDWRYMVYSGKLLSTTAYGGHLFKLTIKKSVKAWGIIDGYSMNKGFIWQSKSVSACYSCSIKPCAFPFKGTDRMLPADGMGSWSFGFKSKCMRT